MPDKRLSDLDDRLSRFREREGLAGGTGDDSAKSEGINSGARAGLELVTSIIAGALIGWGLDRWLGTTPWLMIVFLFLGVGAGFMSVYRITQGLGSAVGFASLQKSQKTATKPPETNTDEED